MIYEVGGYVHFNDFGNNGEGRIVAKTNHPFEDGEFLGIEVTARHDAFERKPLHTLGARLTDNKGWWIDPRSVLQYVPPRELTMEEML